MTGSTRRQRVAAAVLVGAAVATGATTLAAPARADGACTIFWTGARSTAWTDAGNWAAGADGSGAAGRRPASTDVVCVADAPARASATLSGAVTVTGLSWTSWRTQVGLVVRDGARLNATGAGDSRIDNLEIGVARIGGPGRLTLRNATATGTTFSTAALDVAGSVKLDDGTLVGTAVTVPWQQRLVASGDLHFAASASVTVRGQVAVQPDADSGTSVWSGAGRLLLDRGTNQRGAYAFGVLADGQRWQLAVPFANGGELYVDRGQVTVTRPLDLRNGTLGGTGVWTVRDGGDLELGGPIRSVAATLEISGPTLAEDTATLARVTGTVRAYANGGWSPTTAVTVAAGGTLAAYGIDFTRVQVASGGRFVSGDNRATDGVRIAAGGVLDLASPLSSLTADVVNAGRFGYPTDPSTDPTETAEIDGDYTALAGSTTQVSSMTVSGRAQLGGTFSGRTYYQRDVTYTVLEAAQVAGTFAAVTAPAAGPVSLTYSSTAVTARVD